MTYFFNPDEMGQRVFARLEHFTSGTLFWQARRLAQLICVNEGVVTVRTDQGLWVVPPQRAVWVLPGMKHSISASRPYGLCTLYVDSAMIPLPKRCAVVALESLLHELLLAAAQFGSEYDAGSAEERLLRVAVERLPLQPMLPVLPLHLPEPKDGRLRRITEGLEGDPSDARSLSEWARSSGLTERTAERLFHLELGMTFGAWRQQLRLLVAMAQLAHGESVTNVALEVGYSNVSAFIAMFKNAVGVSPAQYFRQRLLDSVAPPFVNSGSLRGTA